MTLMMKTKSDYQASLTPDPTADGVTHINIHYNFAKTQLGRLLASYYVSTFTHPYFGPFKCIEGFWLYVKTGCRDEAFRRLTGVKAKAYYKRLVEDGEVKDRAIPNSEHILLIANYAKIASNDKIRNLLKESTLPFDLYYLHGTGEVPVRPPGGDWTTEALTKIRQLLMDEQLPEPMRDSDYAKLIKR